MKDNKAQSSIEYVSMFAFVVIIGVIAAVFLWQSGGISPVECQKYSSGFSQVKPTDWAAYMDSDEVVLSVVNEASQRINLTNVSFSLARVVCRNDTGVSIETGKVALLNLTCTGNSTLSDTYNGGECYKSEVGITYVNTRTGRTYQSMGTIFGKIDKKP